MLTSVLLGSRRGISSWAAKTNREVVGFFYKIMMVFRKGENSKCRYHLSPLPAKGKRPQKREEPWLKQEFGGVLDETKCSMRRGGGFFRVLYFSITTTPVIFFTGNLGDRLQQETVPQPMQEHVLLTDLRL